MTIRTRNEVLVTCEDTPLMELLKHLAKDHAPDLDYCLEELGLEPQPQLLTELEQVEELATGTIIKDADGNLYCSCGKWWASLESISRGFFDEILATSIQLPIVVVFTPEVQA